MFTIEVSAGELADRMTICLIKAKNIKSATLSSSCQADYLKYYDLLTPIMDKIHTVVAELERVNADLWRVEDCIRDALASYRKEHRSNLNARDAIISLSGKIVALNGRRSDLKNTITAIVGGGSSEVKQYGS